MTRRLSQPPVDPPGRTLRYRHRNGQGSTTVPRLKQIPSWPLAAPNIPLGSAQDPEGFAFTAVSPFYKEWTWSTRSVIGFSQAQLEDHAQSRLNSHDRARPGAHLIPLLSKFLGSDG